MDKVKANQESAQPVEQVSLSEVMKFRYYLELWRLDPMTAPTPSEIRGYLHGMVNVLGAGFQDLERGKSVDGTLKCMWNMLHIAMDSLAQMDNVANAAAMAKGLYNPLEGWE